MVAILETRTLTTAKGKTVTTHLTDMEAINIISELSSSFAKDLVRKFWRYGLSHDQIVWVHVLAMDTFSTPQTNDTRTFANIVSFFQNAANHLRRPKVAVRVSGHKVTLKYKGDGSVQIIDKEDYQYNKSYGKDMPVWYGKVTREGNFIAGVALPGLTKVLDEFNESPEVFAKVYGKQFGHCCFCGLELSTDESLAVGYGPVCAEHYGLPWG